EEDELGSVLAPEARADVAGPDGIAEALPVVLLADLLDGGAGSLLYLRHILGERQVAPDRHQRGVRAGPRQHDRCTDRPVPALERDAQRGHYLARPPERGGQAEQ